MRWFLGAILLLVIGIAFQLGLLVYAMYVLLGVMLVSRYLAREWIENITAERECSPLRIVTYFRYGSSGLKLNG